MKLVDLETLSRMPNGTAFSEITSDNFYQKGIVGDLTLNGISILTGHDETYCKAEDGRFNGVVTLLNTVCVSRDKNGMLYLDDFTNTIGIESDATKYDFNPQAIFVVYDKSDIVQMINTLLIALDDM